MLSDATQLLRDARTLNLRAFGDAAFAWLSRQIPFDGGALITSSAHEPSFMDAHFHNLQVPDIILSWEGVAHLNLMGQEMLARPGEALNQSADDPRIAGEAYAPIREHLERFHIRHALGISIPQPGTALSSVLLIHRSDAAAAFEEKERLNFQARAAILIEAWAINRILCARLLTPQVDPEDAMALIGPDGWIRYATALWTHAVFGNGARSPSPRVPPGLGEAPLGKEIPWQNGAWYARREAVDGGYLIQLRPPQAIDELGMREREVARLYAQGLNYKDIAQVLELSPHTVRNHIQNIFRKLGVSNRHDLARRLKARADQEIRKSRH